MARHSRGKAQPEGRRGGRSMLAFDIRWPKLPRVPSLEHPDARRILIGGAIVAVLLVLAVAGETASSFGRIHPGVTVGGVAVGGMTTGEARALLLKDVEPRISLPVTVTHESRRWTITRSRIGASFAPQAYITRAYAVGRTGNVLRRAGERVSAWFGRQRLPLAVQADDKKLERAIADLGRSVYVPARDAGVSIDGTKVERTSAASGRRVIADALSESLTRAFVAQNRIVKLPVETYAPRVSDADAEQAYRDATRMLSDGLELTYDKKSWKYAPDRIARWISFRAVPFTEASRTPSPTEAPAPASTQRSGATSSSAESSATSSVRMVLQAYIAARDVSATLQPVVKGLGKPPKNATFKVTGKQVSVVPGQVGTGVDMVALASLLDRTLKAEGRRVVPLVLTETQPGLTTEAARAMGIRGLISSYSTDYDPGNAPRVNNIHTLAKALSGKLVPPGGTFSFNSAVGERTAAKGYQEAPAIVDGRLVPQMGGGICQIGTTFFNAVFFSGLPVIERTNHSFYISHYPKGRDCTVSWGGPDFRWKNDTKSWVLVRTDFSDSSVTIALYGADPGYKVDYTTGPFTNVTPYGTSEELDPTLAAGKKETVESGVDGRKVVVVRTVTRNGALVRRDTFTSVYRPKDATVRVGTLAPSQPSTETTAPKKQ